MSQSSDKTLSHAQEAFSQLNAEDVYIFPASSAQKRLWVQQQLVPESPFYNIPLAMQIHGFLDRVALEASLNELIRRHEALRTTFAIQEGQLVQIIAAEMTLPLLLQDLRTLPLDQRQLEVRHILNKEAQRPFDLVHDPLFRAQLLHTDEHAYVLSLNWHHSIFDGWSLNIFKDELTRIYAAFRQRLPSPLPDLKIQYVDYIHWQEQWQQENPHVLNEHLEYWRKQLREAPPLLELPTDHPRPKVASYQGAHFPFLLPLSLLDRLQELSRQEGVTLFMTLLAAFQTLLTRYSQQDDIVVGIPTADRDDVESQSLIGCLINMAALRTNFSHAPSFRQALQQVRDLVLEAMDHHALPFEYLVEALQPERSPGYHPLFQVMFTLEKSPLELQVLDDLTLHPLEVETASTKLDLSLEISESAKGLNCRFEYSTDLFEAETIARMAGHFHTLLEGIVANPLQPVARLPLLTEQEHQQLLIEQNQTHTAYPGSQCVHRLFEQQAARMPEAIALIYGEQRLSYRTLNERANQLAHYLQRQGVGPEVPVGICMERSLELVVGIIGILKAGGAYVPLDPSYPLERLAFMVQDTQLPFVLLKQQLLIPEEDNAGRGESLARAFQQPKCMYLDACRETIERESKENLSCEVYAENLAYIIYTSGSTGQPKGTRIPHRSIPGFIYGVDSIRFDEKQVYLQYSSISWDAFTLELWPALVHGARCVLHAEEMMTPEGLGEAIRTHGVTTLWLPSALFNSIITSKPEILSPVQQLLVGGEALSVPHVRRALTLLPNTAIINGYGPSECTVFACCYPLPQSLSEHTPSIPIGKPIGDRRAYVLDTYLQLVPVGIVGELYIGGDSVARDYLNRPDLTAEKFLPDPFSTEPGARLYKTGDLVRRLPDGNLTFVGRSDNQVKLRGFRIELDEIEFVLNQHPAVHECLVILKQDAVHDKYLVAYLVVQQNIHATSEVLRSYLQTRLPEYMIPQAFVMLNQWPLTPNRKIDRRALPEPAWAQVEQQEAMVLPRTPLETHIAQFWSEILHVQQIGIHQNFFELGGHSLLAMQLAAKLSDTLKHTVSLKQIFLNPTIASLAETLQASATEKKSSKQDMLEAVSRTSPQRKAPTIQLHSTATTTFEKRPLLSLIATRKQAPVDAAAFGYLFPSEFARMNPQAVLQELFQEVPVLTDILETSLGRIGVIILPILNTDLYLDQSHLVRLCIDGLEMAQSIGAQVVSLTGLIPSATAYGTALVSALKDKPDLPLISTGHATTTAAVVLTIQRLLAEAAHDLTKESVGFIGLGSIGLATLRLMLSVLPHPRELLLCDLYSQKKTWEAIQQELRTSLNYRGAIRFIESTQTAIPAEFYESTLIVGATNVADVLDIAQLRPGTLLIDDSGPHCFDVQQAITRFETQGDIVFTEGGALQSPQAITRVSYLPLAWETALGDSERERSMACNPFEIMGCALSGLLSAHFDDLVPTTGVVDVMQSRQHYKRLQEHSFRAAPLHCEQYVLPEAQIRAFQQRFGH